MPPQSFWALRLGLVAHFTSWRQTHGHYDFRSYYVVNYNGVMEYISVSDQIPFNNNECTDKVRLEM